MEKSLDRKLANIARDPDCGDFILADAKDADMGGGLAAPGPRNPSEPAAGLRSLSEYRQAMRDVTAQGLVDIMLMSASSAEQLALDERIFDDSPVTAAARANDTTDIWMAGSTAYARTPSRPFATASIDQIQCGKHACTVEERQRGVNLGLYSMTFNNDLDHDLASLEAYRQFRLQAEEKGFRHFLEVFAPNALVHPVADVGRYVNDCIVRALAGAPRRARPLFLKMPYFGPAAMEALAAYDRSIVIGILGGPSGTTHDAFRMLWEARRYGARAALFGRKINNSEDQLTFVRHLRMLADGELEPEEAVRAYHAALDQQGVPPLRPLEEDLVLTQLAAA